MESPSLILLSQQDVLTRAMDVVANNVANINTTGYKRQDIQFSTLINMPTRGEKLDFVIDRATYRDMAPGSITTTGNPLDIAIQGEGYLPIQTKAGTRYTRAGSFQLNANGEIATADGNKLLGDGGQAIVASSEIESVQISSDGVVTGKTTSADGSIVQIGKIKLASFAREQELQSTGNGLYSTTQTPQTVANQVLIQGALERSNVDSVSEMTRMITVLRAYQQTAKMIDAETQRLTSALAKLSRATA